LASRTPFGGAVRVGCRTISIARRSSASHSCASASDSAKTGGGEGVVSKRFSKGVKLLSGADSSESDQPEYLTAGMVNKA
jgi:hypothetical protein